MTITSVSAHSLVEAMTLEEKASLTLGSEFWYTAGVERVGVASIMLSDGPHGLRTQLKESDHVGLSGSVPATCFPTACALGSSWNPELFADVGRAIASEARKWSVAVVLGPGINMKRSPLCGRNFEYLSEDPWLAGELATAMVKGVQQLGVGTSLKHFAVNNQEEDRLRVSADVDERALREIYLPAFERVVTDAQPWTVMCAYNKVNGIYASEHHGLLTEILRDEWGFQGLVMSDWGAVHNRVAALAAGLDLEMPPDLGVSDAEVVAAVRSGSLPVEILDESARRVVRLVQQATPAMLATDDFDEQAHHELARRAARECAVLLKNDGHVLPLLPAPGETIAVIGEFARTPRFQGAGSSQVNATRIDSALHELQVALPAGAALSFAAGFTLDGDAAEGEADVDEQELVDEAVALAARADHVLLFLGLPAAAESEGFDRTHMNLPTNQLDLLDSVTDVASEVVVVLTNGSTVLVASWQQKVAAILECWLAGQASGGAIADLLLGVANPSGKLAETIPVRLEDVPSTLNFPGDSGHVRYGEGLFIGYRGHDKLNQDVSYPFGFGLSYTRFTISDVAVEMSGAVATGDLRATVTALVTNTGEVAGAEVVQVYVGDPESTVARPIRELKAATKLSLRPGETRRVEMGLDQRAFSFWSDVHHRWAVEAGEFHISVGASSRDFAATVRVAVSAPSLAPPLGPNSTLREWLADDAAKALLTAELTADGADPLILDPELVKVIGTMPLRTLAGFPIGGMSHDQLNAVLAQLGGTENESISKEASTP